MPIYNKILFSCTANIYQTCNMFESERNIKIQRRSRTNNRWLYLFNNSMSVYTTRQSVRGDKSLSQYNTLRGRMIAVITITNFIQ